MPVNRQQTSQQLNFLQEKIKQVGSAIFYNLSDSLVKLPTSVVTSLRVDDYGYIWFFVKKPHQNIKEFEMEFPVKLDFFKKGVDYFLQVSGKGWAVTDPEEVNGFLALTSEGEAGIDEDMVLVKVKMMKAEYSETAGRTRHSWWSSAVNVMTTWFRSTNNIGTNTYFPAS